MLGVPFVRNAYSLIGATLATSGLGVVFWVVAARSYSTADVGTDAALISAMVFLSHLAQLNLASGFNRFVPTAGSATRRLVLLGYLAAGILAAVVASVFVAGIGMWTPRLSVLAHDHWRAAWFIAATVIWTIFVLQDAVLTGLGEAPWVLVENATYGVLKLAVLGAVALFIPHVGVFFAWTVPLVVLVVPVNRLLFHRLIPSRRDRPSRELRTRSVARYVSADFAASALSSATSGLMPLLVLARLGADASAYVYLSWSIAYTLRFLSENVGMSLITEGSRDPDHLIDYARQALTHSLRVVVPLAAAIAIGAPLVLRAFGADYASNATRLLQFMTISAIPNAVVVTYLGVARVRRRMRVIVTVTVVQSALTLFVAVVLLGKFGLNGVGLAWLLADSAVAVVLLTGEFRTVWLPYVNAPGLRRMIRSTGISPRGRLARGSATVARDALLASGLSARGWDLLDGGVVGTDVLTVALRSRSDDARAILETATSSEGVLTIERRRAAMLAVHAAAPEWSRVVPRAIAADPAQRWLLESRCDGVDARFVLDRPAELERCLDDVVLRMNRLYRETAGMTVVDETRVAAIVDRPLMAPRLVGGNRLRAPADARSLDRARVELRAELAGSVLTTAFVHGNLWLGNVLWAPETATVSGIVDWTCTTPGFPVVDIVHLTCSTRALSEHREIGAVLCDLLESGEWPDREARLLESVPGAHEVSLRSVLLLTWIQHVAGMGPAAFESQVWMAHNVHRVLECV